MSQTFTHQSYQTESTPRPKKNILWEQIHKDNVKCQGNKRRKKKEKMGGNSHVGGPLFNNCKRINKHLVKIIHLRKNQTFV